MSSETHLTFDSFIGKQKPNSIRDKTTECPFCNVAELETIIDQDGEILLVENKYPTLRDTYQTVLIETNTCDLELSQYSKQHLYRLIRFGMKHWYLMMENKEYKSVLFYKNHGPLSGGTIHHAHMQIVGLHTIDYSTNVSPSSFAGITIHKRNSVDFTLSTEPRMGFYEFNVNFDDISQIDTVADYIQTAVHYLLHHFPFKCTSYNLFFYKTEGKIHVKIIPRFIISPLFVGYAIPQVAANIDTIVKDVQQTYFLEA